MSPRRKILIVDDSEMNRAILCSMLDEDYDVIEAPNGESALAILRSRGDLSLMLLDMVMPDIDGLKVMERMQAEQLMNDVPVIIISAENSPSFITRAYELGAADYIARPFHQGVVRQRVVNTMLLYAKQRQMAEIIEDQVRENDRNNKMMLQILSNIVGMHNGESAQHILRIRHVTHQILSVMDTDYTEKDISLIMLTSSLHDIGKIGVPQAILNKPGRLTQEEFAIIKTHPVIGADLLHDLKEYQTEPLIRYAEDICRWHHERVDGNGYPDGLKGDEIPLHAQVVGLADVYDALTHERCYKLAFPKDVAVRMILNGECGKFSDDVLQAFIKVLPALSDAAIGETDDMDALVFTSLMRKIEGA